MIKMRIIKTNSLVFSGKVAVTAPSVNPGVKEGFLAHKKAYMLSGTAGVVYYKVETGRKGKHRKWL